MSRVRIRLQQFRGVRSLLMLCVVLTLAPILIVNGRVAELPVAYDVVVTTPAGAGVSGQLAGSSGGGTIFELLSAGTSGTATLVDSSTGAFTFQPAGGFTGLDKFTFQVSDGVTWSEPGTVFVFVTVTGTPDISRVSVATGGAQANNSSTLPVISADGRYVAFISNATSFVANAPFPGVYVHDRVIGTTSLVSKSTSGNPLPGRLARPSLSADGRFVAFTSNDAGFVAGDANNAEDVFVHDRLTGETVCVSVTPTGVPGNNRSAGASVSADGRFVSFFSSASNLVTGDANGRNDIFVRDLVGQTTERVSIATGGSEANQDSSQGTETSISADGSMVAFGSLASNLVPDDSPAACCGQGGDVFVRNRRTGQTRLISRGPNGLPNNQFNHSPSISADGRVVAFISNSPDYFPDRQPGGIQIIAVDLRTGESQYVGVTNSGVFPPGQAVDSVPSVSADGRFVTFTSLSTGLVPNDTNAKRDVFVFDRLKRTTRRASQRPDGIEQDGPTGQPGSSISADGRSVTFDSNSNNLVPLDTFGGTDVFVTDFDVTVPTVAIAGIVTGNGVPLSGVEVRVFNEAGLLWASSFSDSNGNYSITGPQSGTYWLQTRNDQGYVDEAWGGVSCLPSCYARSGVPVMISSGTPASIDFNLAGKGGISGTVSAQQGWAGITAARLVAYDLEGVLRGTAGTGPGGQYVFPDLSPGSYRVQVVHAPAFQLQAYPQVTCLPTCDSSQGNTVAVSAGATTSGIDFSLVSLGAPDAAYLVFGTSNQTFLNVGDTRTHQLVATVQLRDGGELTDVVVAPDGTLAYVGSRGGAAEVIVVDTARLEVVRRIAVEAEPQHLALTPDGTRLYVSHSRGGAGDIGFVTVIDTTTGSVLATLTGGGGGIVVTPDGRQAIVLGPFRLIDTDTNEYSSITLCATPDCPGPLGVSDMVFDANGRAIAKASGQLYALNADTFEVIDRRPIPVGMMAISPNRQILYARYNNNSGAHFDAFLSATLEPIQSLPTWNQGLAIVPIPDGRTLYVGLGDVIDLSSGAFVASVPLGNSIAVSPTPRQGVYPEGRTTFYGGVVGLTSRLVRNGMPLAGKTVNFLVNGAVVGSGVTDAEGVATLPNVSLAGIDVGVYPDLITASFAGDGDASPSSRTARVTIEPAMPVVTWTPAPLATGVPLGPAQLNATANVPGSFTYTPAAGTFPTGAVTIVAMFTPDTLNYLPFGDVRTVPVYFSTPASALTSDPSPGLGWAVDMALDAVANTLYLAHYGTVDILNGYSHAVVGSLLLQSGKQASAVAVSASSQRVFVGTYDGISVFDRGSRVLLETVDIPARVIAVDGATDLVYALGGGKLWVFDPLLGPGDPSRVFSVSTAGCPDSLSFNPSSRLLYVSGNCGGAQVFETDPANAGYRTFITTWPDVGRVIVNRLTERIYAAWAFGSPVRRLRVMEGKRSSQDFHSTLAEIDVTHQDSDSYGITGFTVDANRGLLYAFVASYNVPTVTAFDLATNSLAAAWPLVYLSDRDSWGSVLVNSATHRIYVYREPNIATLIDPVATSATVEAGPNVAPVTVGVGATTVTFSDVTASGSTTAEAANPAAANLVLPGQFSLSEAVGYEVKTTASFTGAITICFDMSSVTDPDAFSALRVLHGENGAWVDRTTSSTFTTGQICGSVTSLSPFAVASYSAAYQVELLFDNTRAFKSGSTIPLKVRLKNNSQNASSALVTVNAKRLRRISTGTTTTTQDSGHANPDGNFRYSQDLGAYLFSLSTKGLESGTYELSFRAAGDAALHTLQFQIK